MPKDYEVFQPMTDVQLLQQHAKSHQRDYASLSAKLDAADREVRDLRAENDRLKAAPHVQPPGQDVLRELVAKWRSEMSDDSGAWETGQAAALEGCADELEAILLRDEAAAALSGASSPVLCACGTTMVCPDIGCDRHKDGVSSPSGAWQPIETAPKDCRMVIGLTWAGVVHPVWWSKTYDQWQWANDGYHSGAAPRLTHWMSLPAPPIPSGDSK